MTKIIDSGKPIEEIILQVLPKLTERQVLKADLMKKELVASYAIERVCDSSQAQKVRNELIIDIMRQYKLFSTNMAFVLSSMFIPLIWGAGSNSGSRFRNWDKSIFTVDRILEN